MKETIIAFLGIKIVRETTVTIRKGTPVSYELEDGLLTPPRPLERDERDCEIIAEGTLYNVYRLRDGRVALCEPGA